MAPVTDRFAAAVYPLVEGESFSWGHPMSAEHRAALLDMVVEVHAAPAEVRDRAPVDDFALQHRDALEAALGEGGSASSTGPYAARVARLVADHAAALRAALTTYDDLVGRAKRRTDAADAAVVLTHGEPHPGNTMRTADGWRLIDWDTARVAPPERDLWSMDPGDGSVHDGVRRRHRTRAAARQCWSSTGRRWDLSDVAVDVAQVPATAPRGRRGRQGVRDPARVRSVRSPTRDGQAPGIGSSSNTSTWNRPLPSARKGCLSACAAAALERVGLDDRVAVLVARAFPWCRRRRRRCSAPIGWPGSTRAGPTRSIQAPQAASCSAPCSGVKSSIGVAGPR